MYKKWIKLIPDLTDNPEQIELLVCPNCMERKVDYLYIVRGKDRMGYLQIWCNSCLTGIYVSRAKAPEKAKVIDFKQKDEIMKIIPKYKFVNE